MKLREYLNELNTLIEQNPSIVEADVYTMSDDEGNERNEVHFTPSITRMNSDGDIVPSDALEEDLQGSVQVVILN